VIVDLKHPQGAGVVLRLAAQADVLVEGYRPGVAERLGIGPADCQARNPRLVYGRMTGWGQEGPLAGAAGHDIAYIALAGALHAIGRAGGPPQVPVNYLGDFGGGAMFLAVGVLAALLEARQSGRGQVVDAAIVDGTAVLQAMSYGLLAAGTWTDQRGVNLLDSGAPFYDVYGTADGRHMAVGAIEPQFYARFLELLFAPDGLPTDLPAQHDRARWPQLRAQFADRFASRAQADWTKAFEGTDACVAPVLCMTEAPRHPHLAAGGTYAEVDGVVQSAPAPRFSEAGRLRPVPTTQAGEHTSARRPGVR
jgi:alpha-methylacyl-CoA racemase